VNLHALTVLALFLCLAALVALGHISSQKDSFMSPQFQALLQAVSRIEAKQAADSKAIADLQAHVTELQAQLATSQEDAAALQQTLDRLNAIAPPPAQ